MLAIATFRVHTVSRVIAPSGPPSGPPFDTPDMRFAVACTGRIALPTRVCTLPIRARDLLDRRRSNADPVPGVVISWSDAECEVPVSFDLPHRSAQPRSRSDATPELAAARHGSIVAYIGDCR
jgi:hypothetical protein